MQPPSCRVSTSPADQRLTWSLGTLSGRCKPLTDGQAPGAGHAAAAAPWHSWGPAVAIDRENGAPPAGVSRGSTSPDGYGVLPPRSSYRPGRRGVLVPVIPVRLSGGGVARPDSPRAAFRTVGGPGSPSVRGANTDASLAFVAQLEEAPGLGPGGWGFESLRRYSTDRLHRPITS